MGRSAIWTILLLLGLSTAYGATDADVIKQAEEHFKAERYREAFDTIKPLADKGSPEAQGKLGALYMWGLGVSRDSAKAVELLKSAAEKNYSRSQHALCVLYRSGNGVPRDPKLAFDWCVSAAKNKNALAMTDVGLFYIHGDHVQRDPEQAYRFWEEAAGLGDIRANLNIAEMLDRGDLRGVKDPMGAVARRMAANLARDSFCANVEWPCPEPDALETCNAKVLVRKLNQGLDANTKAKAGHSALHCAGVKGDAELAGLAMQKGAQIDATNPNGVTALHLAAQSGSLEVVALLVTKGANVNATTHAKATPLHAAVLGRNERVVSFLIDKGADVNARGEEDATPLDVAVRPRRNASGAIFLPDQRIVELLKTKGGKCVAGQC